MFKWRRRIDHTDYTYLTFTQQESFKSYSVSLAKSFSATDLAKTEVLGLSSCLDHGIIVGYTAIPIRSLKTLTGEAFLKAKLKEEGVTELKSHGKPSGLLWRQLSWFGDNLSIASKWIICIPGAPIVPMINGNSMSILGPLHGHASSCSICFVECIHDICRFNTKGALQGSGMKDLV